MSRLCHFVLSCRLWTPLSYSFEQFIQVAVLVKFPGKQKVFSTQLVLLIAPLKPLSAFIRNYSLRSLYHWIISILKMRIQNFKETFYPKKQQLGLHKRPWVVPDLDSDWLSRVQSCCKLQTYTFVYICMLLGNHFVQPQLFLRNYIYWRKNNVFINIITFYLLCFILWNLATYME